MEDAIQKAAKSRYGAENDIRCEIDAKTGEARLSRVDKGESPAVLQVDGYILPGSPERCRGESKETIGAGIACDSDTLEGECFAHNPPTTAYVAEQASGPRPGTVKKDLIQVMRPNH